MQAIILGFAAGQFGAGRFKAQQHGGRRTERTLAIGLGTGSGWWHVALLAVGDGVPAGRARDAATGQPREVGDIRDATGRELLLHHRDPYGAEVSREIQWPAGHGVNTATAIVASVLAAVDAIVLSR
jgi:hypothetical protein